MEKEKLKELEEFEVKEIYEVVTGVKDEASNSFLELKTTSTCAVAIRGFAEFVQGNKFIEKNAKDFNLYFLGNWNKVSGELIKHEPSIIAMATEFTSEKKEIKENK